MPYSSEFESGVLNLNRSGGEEKTNRRSITPLVPILLLLLLGSAPADGQKIVNMSLRAHLDLGDLGAMPVCPISGLNLRVNDVWGYDSPTGQAMALVGLCDGTAIVDVSDVATATVLTTIPGPRSVWRDIKTFDHYAYVIHDVVHSTDPAGTGVGVQIIDLADPAFPVVSTLTDGFIRAHNLYIDEDLEQLYVVGWDPDAAALVGSGFHPENQTAGFAHGFRIYDLSADPENPIFLGMWDERYVHDLHVRNNTVYAAALSDGLWFVDISDPSAPSTIDHITYTQGPPGPALNNFTHNVWVTDDGSTAVVTDEALGQRLKFFDVSDLSAAVKIAEYEAKPGILPHSAFIAGDKTYVSYYSEGAVILDISDPAAPLEIGYYDTFLGAETHNGAWGMYPFSESGLIYVSDIVSGLYVFEFHPPHLG